MAQNLEELKTELYDSFNDARKKLKENIDYGAYSYPNNAKVAVKAAEAAGKIADAIVKVEREIAEREEKKNGMRLPGK